MPVKAACARELPEPLQSRFARRLDRALGELPAPGLSAAVLVDDTVLWTYATGLARFRPDVPMTTRHVHRIGSITKLFTAHAVLLLRDEGKLDLDVPVGRYIPEFRPEGERVTLRHLLCHGSGITGEGGNNVWESGRFPDAAHFREQIRRTRPVAPPMVYLKYSNFAYSMLGLAVEAAAGMSYERFVRERMLQPLGMTETSFDPTPDMAERFAAGHHVPPFERRFAETPHQELHAFRPCGMLLSTPADLLKLAHTQWSGEPLLAPATRDEMLRLHLVDSAQPGWQMGYGLGFRQIRRGDRVYSGHSGAYIGYRCAMELSVPDRIAVLEFRLAGERMCRI